MECSCIPYSRLPKSSALFLDYLYHFDRVARFYTGPPFDVESYHKLSKRLSGQSKNRTDLVEILKRQNQAFGCGEATFASIRRLSEPGTFAVVTGQQVGLVSGPAFTLYKALTAVKLSQWLTEQGLPSVPVFWLATEDHDLEEVARAATLNEEYELIPLEDAGERPAPRSPVGRVKLSAGIGSVLEKIQSVLAPGECRDRLMEDLRACYQPGATWGHAFGRLMARLFTRWGVVLLDPLDESVHRLSVPVYGQALRDAKELRARLKQRSEDLARSGYHAQVHIGEDSTLLFLTREGNRQSLHFGAASEAQKNGGEFSIEDSVKISRKELDALVRDRPLDFTPNALLRPIVQDALLPTIAYVAGPSELAYLGQAQAIYEAFGRPQPVLFPRAGFTLVDRRVQRWVEKYRVGVEDVWQGEEHLRGKIAANGLAEGWAERFERTEKELAGLLERLRGDVQALDPTLLDTVKHAQEKMNYQMERLKGKITRAAFERSELLARHEQAMARFLAPGKDLQEREVSGIYFLGRAGYGLLERLLAQIQTRSSDHQVVVY